MGANESHALALTKHPKQGDVEKKDETKTQELKASAFEIQIFDEAGNDIKPDKTGCYDPARKAARRLVFSVTPNDTDPTAQQMEFCRSLEAYQHAIREIYLEPKKPRKPNELTFKEKFVELFYLSQLILEGHVTVVTEHGKQKKKAGRTLAPDVAKKEIELLYQALIDDEAPYVKNQQFKSLRDEALKLLPFFLVAYAVLRLLDPTKFGAMLWEQFEIQAFTASNFMLLWVGVFVGVCLSYAIRTQQFTLTDLTRPSADYFSPRNRLLLAGALVTVLAYLSMVGLGDIKIGELSLQGIASNPMVALTAGAIMGLFEYKLTGLVAGRAGALLPADTR